MTKEELIQEVLDIREAIDKIPTQKEFVKYSSCGWGYRNHFKCYNDLVYAAGLEPRKRRFLSKEIILKWTYDFYRKNHKLPIREELRNEFKEGFVRYCGSYETLIEECSKKYGISVSAEDALPKCIRNTYIKNPENEAVLREKISRELRTLHKEHPEWSPTQLGKHVSVSEKILHKVIGYSKEIKEVLGLDTTEDLCNSPHSKGIPLQDVRDDAIRVVLKHPDLSISIALREYGKYSTGTYYSHLDNVENIKRIVSVHRPINKERKYAIKYSAAPTTLKWMRKRSLLTEV